MFFIKAGIGNREWTFFQSKHEELPGGIPKISELQEGIMDNCRKSVRKELLERGWGRLYVSGLTPESIDTLIQGYKAEGYEIWNHKTYEPLTYHVVLPGQGKESFMGVQV